MSTGIHLSLNDYQLIKIGADRANEYARKMGKSVILLTGDSSATVDPTTGLGCNTAIQSSVDFLDFLWDSNRGIAQDKLINEYEASIKKRIEFIHEKSR